ncbi:hypothetical protein [Glycomyces artemisiae]|uniref:Uncharacterized protein n=1 Tax=Glycomyces artemisiae TaxID=1076443 RepID=A0A2T0UA18_9ACTN|nr:hypothetical protein [Glycomyces artemisiae]PRY54766.1 hypothetical protein B0I28_11438 [Glycomyces artemisiae]
MRTVAAEDFAAGVDAIADAVLAVPGVTGLHGSVAVLLPGRRVPGLRLGDTDCEVHVTVAWGTDIPAAADAIRAAVAPLAEDRAVSVVIEDIAAADDADPAANKGD